MICPVANNMLLSTVLFMRTACSGDGCNVLYCCASEVNGLPCVMIAICNASHVNACLHGVCVSCLPACPMFRLSLQLPPTFSQFFA